MNMNFDMSLAINYRNPSQKTRVITEGWFKTNMYCPRCGNLKITHLENNKPVADFCCEKCNSTYELKSKNGSLTNKINDGAYSTMIDRITENKTTDLICMRYTKTTNSVVDLQLIPKYFFVPNIIEKRKTLSDNARRSGWTGCNILIGKIPEQAKIIIVENGRERSISEVVKQVKKCDLLQTKDIVARGWLLDILNCINAVKTQDFMLSDMYSFEKLLYEKHPENNNIQAKIRQQLQFLRDKGFVEFLGNGKYRKVM